MSNESGDSESNDAALSEGAIDKDWSGLVDGMESDYKADTPSTINVDSLQKTWQDMPSMMRITPKVQKQTYVATTISHIAEGLEEPAVETFPICDPQITPHQISFDFFDTTEGKIGVSNATEKHFTLECDVYVNDLIYMYWNHGSGSEADYSKTKMSGTIANDLNTLLETCEVSDSFDFVYTSEFYKFRRNFLQQHSGWVCTFTSSMFETFEGVITSISYDIGSGETDAKFHLKIEEAVFTDDYSTTGVKKEDTNNKDGNSNGSQSNSGENSLMSTGDTGENLDNNLINNS